MTKKKIKLVVSDFHIGSGRYFKDGSPNILEDFKHDEAFISFLRYYSTGSFQSDEVELIINGDFLNLLQINYKGVHSYMMTERIVLEGLRGIFRGHRELFEELKSFGKAPNHTITYIVGNHDQGMLFEKPRKFFSQALEHDVKYFDSFYEFDQIRVEHGHMHEPPTRFEEKQYFISKGLPEPILNLPWGSLFVAECLPKIKMERDYVDKVKPFSLMLRWMVFNDALFALKSFFRIIWFFINVFFFKGRYRFWALKATWNIIKQVNVYPDFDREAFKVLKENSEINTLIMGHTHVLRYRKYREGKEYYNTGTWNEATNLVMGKLGTELALTYALIEYPEVETGDDKEVLHDKTFKKPMIRLKEWKGYWRPEIDASI